MRKILAVVFALTLSGCAGFQLLSGTSVPPTAVYVAVNSFDAVEATATNYLRLKKCSPTSGSVCRSPTATAKIIPAVRSGRVARTNLEQFYKDNPGALGPASLYNALVTATSTLNGIMQAYNIGATQ